MDQIKNDICNIRLHSNYQNLILYEWGHVYTKFETN